MKLLRSSLLPLTLFVLLFRVLCWHIRGCEGVPMKPYKCFGGDERMETEKDMWID